MNVIINGEQHNIDAVITVLELLESFALDPEITIVEKNQVIVSRETYGRETVRENDVIELIRYLGGG